MKTLILSCNTGGGHNAAGLAIAKELNSLHLSSTFLDALSLAGEKYSKYVSKVYTALVNNMPHMFGAIYRISESMSNPNKGPRLCWITRSFQTKLMNYIENGDFDIIVTTHFFVAQVLTILQTEGKLSIPVVAIITDYTCGPFWEETTCDYYIIPHANLTEEFIAKGVPTDKLYPLGIPVDSIFNTHPNSLKAKEQLGIPSNQPMILMMSGSMGHGDLSKRVDEILHLSTTLVTIIIICGNNSDLQEKLSQKYCHCPSIYIKGFESNISSFMDAATVLLTKSGGLTSTEAAVKNIPLIHVDSIPGCETKNAKFFQKRNMSLVCSTLQEEAKTALTLCHDQTICTRIKTAQQSCINPHAASDIVALLLRITKDSHIPT